RSGQGGRTAGATSTSTGNSSVATSTSTGTGGASTTGAGGSATAGTGGRGTGGAGTGGAGTGGAGGAGPGGGGPGSRIDPQCLDGKAYAAEPIPDRSISVDDLIASYNPSNVLPWTIQMLNRRYPIGAIGASVAQQKNSLDCFNVAFSSTMPNLQTA